MKNRHCTLFYCPAHCNPDKNDQQTKCMEIKKNKQICIVFAKSTKNDRHSTHFALLIFSKWKFVHRFAAFFSSSKLFIRRSCKSCQVKKKATTAVKAGIKVVVKFVSQQHPQVVELPTQPKRNGRWRGEMPMIDIWDATPGEKCQGETISYI